MLRIFYHTFKKAYKQYYIFIQQIVLTYILGMSWKDKSNLSSRNPSPTYEKLVTEPQKLYTYRNIIQYHEKLQLALYFYFTDEELGPESWRNQLRVTELVNCEAGLNPGTQV